MCVCVHDVFVCVHDVFVCVHDVFVCVQTDSLEIPKYLFGNTLTTLYYILYAAHLFRA